RVNKCSIVRGRLTSPMHTIRCHTRRCVEHLCNLSLCKTSLASRLCYLICLHTTDARSVARFHFFNRLKQLVAKLLSTQSLITHVPIPHESTSGYARVCSP